MQRVKSFKHIVAWQRGKALATLVYRTTCGFPDSERFGLVNQMRRAAVSVPSNIAEGYGRETKTDFLRFLRVARGSLFELQTQAEIAQELGMAQQFDPLFDLIHETDRVLQAFIRGLEDAPLRS